MTDPTEITDAACYAAATEFHRQVEKDPTPPYFTIWRAVLQAALPHLQTTEPRPPSVHPLARPTDGNSGPGALT